MSDERVVVTVDILGQRYPIRSTLDTSYVTELATYVDRKMQTAAEKTNGDSVRVAVLAALNIADEYFRYRKHGTAPQEAPARRSPRPPSSSSSSWTRPWPTWANRPGIAGRSRLD